MKPHFLIAFIFASLWSASAEDWDKVLAASEKILVEDPAASVVLPRLVEYARNNRHLEELAPRWEARTSGPDGLAYRVMLGRMARENQKPEEARSRLEEAASLAPMDPRPWAALGLIDRLDDRDPQAAFKKAAELELTAGKLGYGFSSWATFLSATGRSAEAFALYERGWPLAGEGATRYRFIASAAGAAFKAEKLGASIQRLEAAQGKGDVIASSDLVAIYLTANDPALAKQVLAEAKKRHPSEAVLYASTILLARRINDGGEEVGLLREVAGVFPSPEIWAQLFGALVRNESIEEARKLMEEHGEDIARAGALNLTTQLHNLRLTEPMAALLQRYEGGAGWEAIFTHSEMLTDLGRSDEAMEVLWKLFDPALDDRPSVPIFRADEFAPIPVVAAIESGQWSYRRAQIRNTQSMPTMSFRSYVTTLRMARDSALRQMAQTVSGTSRAAAFPSRLAEAIKAFPIGERIFAWCVVENIEHLLLEVESYVQAGPGDPELNQLCRDLLMTVGRSQGLEPVLASKRDLLFDKLPAPVAVGKAIYPGMDSTRAISSELSQGKVLSATAKLEELVEHFPDRRSQLAGTFHSYSTMYGGGRKKYSDEELLAFVRAFSILDSDRRRLSEPPSEHSLWVREPPEGGGRWIPEVSMRRMDQRQQTQKSGPKPVFPPNSLISYEITGVLWRNFGPDRPGGPMPEWREKLETLAAELPAERALYVRTVIAYVTWWAGETEDAVKRMRALMAESKNEGFLIGLASMLMEQNQTSAADELLQQVVPPYPGFQRVIDLWRLRLAAEAKDKEKAGPLAKKVVDAPFTRDQLGLAKAFLTRAGLVEEAAVFRRRLIAMASPADSPYQITSTLNDLIEAGQNAECLTMAKNILAGSLRSDLRAERGSGTRSAAINALGQIGELTAYADALEPRAMAPAATVDDLLRFAEVSADEKKREGAWRKVMAIEPKNELASRSLAARSPTMGGPGIRMFETRFPSDPLGALQSNGRQVIDDYEKNGLLARLTDMIVSAKFSRSPTPFNDGRWVEPTFWLTLAERSKDQNGGETSLAVLKKAVEASPEFARNEDIQQAIAKCLVALGRRDEAVALVADVLLPANGGTPPVLAFSPAQNPRSLVQGYTLLQTGYRLGLTEELRRRIDLAAADPSLKSYSSSRELRMMMRCFDHESGALPELAAYLDGIKEIQNYDRWMLPVMSALAGWPEASEVMKKVFDLYGRSIEKMNGIFRAQKWLELAQFESADGSRDFATLAAKEALKSLPQARDLRIPETISRIATMALETQDKDLVAECGQKMVRWMDDRETQGLMNQAELFKFLELLAKAGCITERTALVASLRQRAILTENRDLSRAIDLLDLSAELDRGELRRAGPIVWIDGQHSTAESAQLVWDVGLVTSGNSRETGILSRGEAVPALDGRFDVELFFGEHEEAMQTLARFPKTKSRGIWTGKLPAVSGFVRVSFSDGSRFFFSDAMRVSVGEDLMAGSIIPEFVPTPGNITLDGKVSDGGPVPDGKFLSFLPVSPRGAGGSGLAVTLRRVELKPGHDYTLAGWLRTTEQNYAGISVNFLDRGGNSVGNQQLFSPRGQGSFWTYRTQLLQAARRSNSNGSGVSIPAQAVFAEPVLQGVGAGLDLAALSLVEIPPVKKEEANEEDP